MTEYPRIIEGEAAFSIAYLAGVPTKVDFKIEHTQTGIKVTNTHRLERPVIVREKAPGEFEVIIAPGN